MLLEHCQESLGCVTLIQGKFSEWPGLINIMEGHARQVNCTTFSPDESKIISSSSNGALQFWDARRYSPMSTGGKGMGQ